MSNINLKTFQSIKGKDYWYKTIQYLGKGGNGIAYLVICTSGPFKGEHFALKIFYNISKHDRHIRFLKEIEFLKKTNHPAIMKHYDDGIFKDNNGVEYPFVVTGYMPNTLEHELKKGPIDISKALFYSTQLLSALQELQSINILHRDIKPGNIFINGTSIMLGDFGLIKDLNTQYTNSDNENDIESIKSYLNKEAYSDAPALPFGYRTPELVKYCKGESKLCLESDIFQMGLVIGEMFKGSRLLKRAQSILDPIELNSIGYINTKYNDRIVGLISNMIEINPHKRKSVDKLLDGFIGICSDFWKEKYSLEGKII